MLTLIPIRLWAIMGMLIFLYWNFSIGGVVIGALLMALLATSGR